MKRIVYLVIICLLAVTAVAEGRGVRKAYSGEIIIVPSEMVRTGDSLRVRLDIELGGVKVRSGALLDIVPVITDGVSSVALPKVVLAGRRRYKEILRGRSLDAASGGPTKAVIMSLGGSSSVPCFFSLPYLEWMDKAGLFCIGRMSVGSSDGYEVIFKYLLAKGVSSE